MPSAEALARVRAGRNPLYRAVEVEADPDDRIALGPLLEAVAGDDGAIRHVVAGLTATPAGVGALARHLADVAAIVELVDRDPFLAGRVLGRLYGR